MRWVCFLLGHDRLSPGRACLDCGEKSADPPVQAQEWINKCYPDFRVPCPTCGVPPGVMCRDDKNRTHTKHAERVGKGCYTLSEEDV